MEKRRVKRLPVVRRRPFSVGIITRSDLLRALSNAIAAKLRRRRLLECTDTAILDKLLGPNCSSQGFASPKTLNVEGRAWRGDAQRARFSTSASARL